jgi:hypothetical protein
MDCNNDNTYRDWPSYHHKPIVQGVNYSPLMVQSTEEVLVKEEWWLEVTPAVVPSPIFLQRLAAAPVLCFSCFSAASLRERLGGLYIVVFRSS